VNDTTEWDGDDLAPTIPDTYPEDLASDDDLATEPPADPAIEGTAGLED
jgi:hypothetical protein